METTIDNNVEGMNVNYVDPIELSPYMVKKKEDREHPKFNREKLMQAARLIIEAVGRDPNEPGLIGTPDRLARSAEEILLGEYYSNDDIARLYNTTFEVDPSNDDLVTLCNIRTHMLCEHHLMQGNLFVSIGYIPAGGKVIGLSKLARIANLCSQRLQLQERIGEDIAYCIEKITKSPDIIVVIKGYHGCTFSRQMRDYSPMITATLKGRFKTNSDLRKEFYSILDNASKE